MAQRPLYSPALSDRNVRRLYRLKVEHRKRTGQKIPMTVLVNRILDDFFEAGDAATFPASGAALRIHAAEVALGRVPP